jgi:hypothetical protein
MEAEPKTPNKQTTSNTPPGEPPGTMILFNTPATNGASGASDATGANSANGANGANGATGANSANGASGARGFKRPGNNLNTESPLSKLLKKANNEKLIIMDYNPDGVNEITELGTQNLDIQIVNNVDQNKKDKHSWYPSSFLCKSKSEKTFSKLCIHKFIYNNPFFIGPVKYVLHPNAINLLQKHKCNIKKIELAFKSLQQSQTLLINLNIPPQINAEGSMSNSNSNIFTVDRTTPVIIGDSNSVVVYDPDGDYGNNNENNNSNQSHYTLPKYNLNGTGTNEEHYLNNANVVHANASNRFEDWNALLMATPPRVRAEPAPAENGSPTQIETQIEPQQQPNPHLPPPLRRAHIAPIQIETTTNATQMLSGGHTNKKNKKVSKKTKRKTRKTKQTQKIKKA